MTLTGQAQGITSKINKNSVRLAAPPQTLARATLQNHPPLITHWCILTFAALGQTIKTVVKDSDFKSQMGQGNTTSPEIIDAGAVSSEHDETNPYQDSTQ